MTGNNRHQLSVAIWAALSLVSAAPPPPELLPAAAILDAASLDPARDIPAGGWFVVRGRYLVDESAQPNSTGGVSVSIGWKAATIVRLRRSIDVKTGYDELLAIAPLVPQGTVPMVLTTPRGTALTRTIRVVEFSPSLFSLEQGAGRYVEATASNGAESIGPLDLFGAQPLDRPIRPAVEGEVISLRANGCGVPRITSVRLGDVAAEVLFSGMETSSLPACAIRIRVPALPPGEHEIRALINGELLSPPRWLVVGPVPFPGYQHGADLGFRLTGAHVAVQCAQCHLRDRYVGTPAACEACHLDRYLNTTAPDHRAAGYPATCALCHQTSQFPGARSVHSSAATDCAGCHLPIYDATSRPNHAQAGIGRNCGVCHTSAGWLGAQTDHSRTRFPLTGKHTAAACQSCHGSAPADPQLDRKCAACHLANYQATASPNHAAAEYPTGCDACHTTSAFRPATVDHPRQRFPLSGAHASLSCAQCHQGGKLSALEPSCANCHLPAYEATAYPNHKSSGYPQTCGACHTTDAWIGAALRHDRFPLTGKHAAAGCLACHKDDQFLGTPRTCAACHLPQYDAMTNPNHRAENFSTECQLCHSTSQFFGARIMHPTRLQTGRHARLECARCHTAGTYQGTPQTCAACHLPLYNATLNPNHKAAAFPQSCDSCHTPDAWRGATYPHSRFPLTGKHATARCSQCHASGVFAGTARACAACHLPAYNATLNPNHKAAGFPQSCDSCHVPTGWTGTKFTHARFLLTGKHATTRCNQCHANGLYAATSTACSACHLPAYSTAAKHKESAYPQTCDTCHNTAAWKGATFSHTRFALTGKHTTTSCALCHTAGRYNGTPSACASCHLPAYNAAASPNHKSASISQTCQSCHTTTAWPGAKFTHARFSLTGRHATVKCSQCHTAGVYAGTSTSCATCHLKAYNATINPNHTAAGYPQSCETCHTSASWRGATVPHTRFPLTGRHAAASCTACHSAGSYAATPSDCAACHLPAYNSAANPNHKSAGISQACQSCHNTASWRGATFTHRTFGLAGRHAAVPCTQCHANSVYAARPTTCVSCHLARFNAATRPNHAAKAYPQSCERCHTPAGWSPSSFLHAFPITSGSHNNRWARCTDCHSNPSLFDVASCLGCHTQTATKAKHSAVPTYAYDSTKCLVCHPRP